jgi:hypothetical protein
MIVGLPRRKRGRQSPGAHEKYEADKAEFCRTILQINSTLDFKVSSRGWCYILENKGIITKGEFAAGEKLINDCRKAGALPLDICATDSRRRTLNLEDPDKLSRRTKPRTGSTISSTALIKITGP